MYWVGLLAWRSASTDAKPQRQALSLSLCGSRLVHQGTFATWIISILFWVSIYLHLVKMIACFFSLDSFITTSWEVPHISTHRSMMFLGALEPGAPKAVTGRCWQLDWKARLHQDLPCTSCSILWLIDADLGVQLWLLNGSDICSSMIIACNSHPHGIMALHRLGHPSTFSTLSFLAFSRALPNISGVLTRETVPEMADNSHTCQHQVQLCASLMWLLEPASPPKGIQRCS